MKFLRALILSVIVVVCSTAGLELLATQDSLWQQVEASLQSDDRHETIRLLRLSVFAATNIEESEPLLYSMLGQCVEEVVASGPVNELDSTSLEEAYNLQYERAQLGVATQSDWKMLLDIALAFPEPDRFIVTGQQFLDYYETDEDLTLDLDWLELLNALEKNLTRNEQALYRLRLCKMLVRFDNTNEDYKSRLAEALIFAEAQAGTILELARVAIFMGDLKSAGGYIEQVHSYNPDYFGLEEVAQHLQLATRLEKRLMAATDAFSRKNYKEAEKICHEILERDPSNLAARRIFQQIEDAKERPVARAVGEQDRITLQLRRLNAELREAEKTHDLIAIRDALKELLLLKNDSELISRFEEVEHEISMSRLHARERFVEAISLFQAQQYDKLLMFLNRNPGLMSSMDKLVEVWEMRLMANFYSGLMDEKDLKRSAANILEKAGSSFYANYVLMRLAIADNKMAAAHKYYTDAAAARPDDSLLTMPGLLLWVHGEGRVFAVILLMILLFVAAKSIGPIIKLYEKTWWARIKIVSYLFPSLAIRSIERSFSSFKGEKEQIRLFTLLKQCATKTGDKKRLAIYKQNLRRLLKPDEPDVNEAADARDSDLESQHVETNSDASIIQSGQQGANSAISAREIMQQHRSKTKDDRLAEEILETVEMSESTHNVEQQFNLEPVVHEHDGGEAGSEANVSGIELAIKQSRQQLFAELNGVPVGETKPVEYTENDVRKCAIQMFSELD